MFRKFALGLVAAASMGAAAFPRTAASALGFGFGGGLGHGWGHHWGYHRFGYGYGYGFGGPIVDSCIVVTPYGRLINVCY